METDASLNGTNCSNDARVQVRWLLPNPGEFALNSDGSVVDAGLFASCGGVLRDDSRQFIFGFFAKVGTCSILEAELWGIYLSWFKDSMEQRLSAHCN